MTPVPPRFGLKTGLAFSAKAGCDEVRERAGVSGVSGNGKFQRKSAFSLIELLMVMGIMTILMSFAVPAMSSLAKGNQMNQALSEVAGLLEMARQQATAQNTYVWVAFNDTPQGADDQVRVAVLVSKSGADLASWGTDDTTASTAQTRLVTKPRTFNQVKLGDASGFEAKIPDLPATAADALGTSAFTIKVPGGQNENFNKAIQFTPNGEARWNANMAGSIGLGLQPTRGHLANADNVAVVRVNGLTGQTRIYRP